MVDKKLTPWVHGLPLEITILNEYWFILKALYVYVYFIITVLFNDNNNLINSCFHLSTFSVTMKCSKILWRILEERGNLQSKLEGINIENVNFGIGFI